MPNGVIFEAEDTRTLRLMFKDADDATTEQLGKALVDAGQNGYRLVDAGTMQGGHQRDPITTGVVLRLKR